jgi:hypothetical protein
LNQSTQLSLGIVLLLWGAANSYVDVLNYGWLGGQYWWFCNLALIGMGYGFLANDSAFVVGFLAIALYTQTFWLFDDSIFVLTGWSPLGLVEHIYSPKYPMEEFALAHYHYFTIPLGLIGFISMPIKKGQVLRRVLIFNPLIFGISYFVFSPSLNINCIHQACFSVFGKVTGPLYSFLFWALIFVAHLKIANFLEYLKFSDEQVFGKYQKWIKTAASALVIVGVLLTFRGIQIKTISMAAKDSVEAK